MTFTSALLGRPEPVDVGTSPPADRAPRSPYGRELAGEWRTPLQVLRLTRAAPWLLAGVPRGDGGMVIDLPGWRAPESSNAPLRAYLRLLGHDARGWGLGTNRGNPEADARRLVERLEERDGPPVALVGWSLGGVVAREIARAVPERVRCVVTFGSPVIGGPSFTVAASAYGEEECRRVERLAAELDADRPVQTPITAIYTRNDGVVDWRACIDRSSARVHHVEVRSTHLGLGIDPDVWVTVARALAP